MKNFLKWILLSLSIFAIGTWLYAQTAVIGIPWELRGINVHQGTSATGQVLFRDGVAALPSISFISETTKGIYNVGAGHISVAIGGVQAFTFGPSGSFYINSVVADAGIRIGAPDLFLLRDAANIFAQRNAANAQTFRLYTSYTDGANYERLAISTGAGLIDLRAQTAGTGTDNITFSIYPAGTGNISAELEGGFFRVAQATPGSIASVIVTDPANTDNGPVYVSRQADVLTANAAVTTLYTIALPDEFVYLIEAKIVARCTGGAGGNVGDGNAYVLKQAFKRTGAGVATAIGVIITESWEEQVGWDADLAVDGGNNVLIRVTGGATDNVSWHVTIFIQYLSA